MKLKVVALFALVAASSSVWAGIFGASNFDDCVLESMKGVTSDIAARAIYQSCRQKFPEKQVKHNERVLTGQEIKAVHGRGNESGGYFSADILNGNNAITISQITLAVTTKMGGNQVTNFYTANIEIGPNKTGHFFEKIIVGDSGSKYEWFVYDAKGY